MPTKPYLPAVVPDKVADLVTHLKTRRDALQAEVTDLEAQVNRVLELRKERKEIDDLIAVLEGEDT